MHFLMTREESLTKTETAGKDSDQIEEEMWNFSRKESRSWLDREEGNPDAHEHKNMQV